MLHSSNIKDLIPDFVFNWCHVAENDAFSEPIALCPDLSVPVQHLNTELWLPVIIITAWVPEQLLFYHFC